MQARAAEGGQVRAILGIHARHRLGVGPAPAAPGLLPDGDPNTLVEARPLRDALDRLCREKGDGGEATLRGLAADYVALWARTFRTLVVHLRGRPERALALFAEEVYPFLCGDRLAARVESVEAGRARLLLAHDLPDAYLAGLVESFVRLSRARAVCTVLGKGAGGAVQLEVRYRVEGADRVARLTQHLASLRIPLLAAAFLSALLGISMAYREVGALQPWRVLAVLVGAVAAQGAANALHDLRNPHPAGPLGPVRMGRRALRATVYGGYAAAGALGLLLAVQAPVVVLFAAAGLVVSVLFGKFRNQGYGPLLAGLTYGPLVTEGALHGVAPGAADHLAHLAYALLSVPLGALAAAILYLDDLADRPLDEAGGQRTLVVRLPRRRHLAGYAVLVGGAMLLLLGALYVLAPATTLLAAILGPAAIALAVSVHNHIDDPHGLGPARLGTLALHIAASALLALAILGVLP